MLHAKDGRGSRPEGRLYKSDRSDRGGAFDVAVAGFGAGGRDAEDDEIFTTRGDIESGAEDAAEAFGIGDEMIGGEDGHEGLRIVMDEVESGESDGRGGVASHGLGQDVGGGAAGDHFSHGAYLLGNGDRPEARIGNYGEQAFDGLLEHGGAADDIQELFGRAHAAARPEAGAAATGENDGVSGVFGRGL